MYFAKGILYIKYEVYLALNVCPYFFAAADNFNFNGNSLIEWNLREYPIVSTRDSFGFRLRTNVANGVILYSRGTQGDYIALQLRDNRLALNINLGN